MALGIAISVGGLVTFLASFSHIKKAGELMNEIDRLEKLEKDKTSSFNIQGNQNGLGIGYTF